jgi:hypothetical protein
MPPAGIEPTIPASERPQTHALDRAATGISNVNIQAHNILLRRVVRPVTLLTNVPVVNGTSSTVVINPLKTKRICFI